MSKVCMYNKDGAKVFNSFKDIPKNEGWVDCPTKVKVKKQEKTKKKGK